MKLKMLGAILSACFIVLYFGWIFTLLFYTGVTTGEIPMFYFILLLIVFGIPFFAIPVALWMRIKEIRSGEEEDAKKY